MTLCPSCTRDLPDDCEQAAAVRLFGKCIGCSFRSLTSEQVGEIQSEQLAFLARQAQAVGPYGVCQDVRI